MLVMSKGALSAAQAETYYEEKYSQDDYYTEKRESSGQWFGEGATALGLAGEVARRTSAPCCAAAAFNRRGYRPQRKRLAANGAPDGTRPSTRPSRSASKHWLAATTRLAEAHRAAVTRALAELEHYALSRQRGGSEWVVTENIVAARFDHIAARPAKAPMTATVPTRISTPTSSSPT